jgi:plastocyanin
MSGTKRLGIGLVVLTGACVLLLAAAPAAAPPKRKAAPRKTAAATTTVKILKLGGSGTGPVFGFEPSPVQLSAAGGTVTWVNRDFGGWHSAVSDAGAPFKFDTGRLEPGASKTITFPPGNYTVNYHDAHFPDTTGSIVVGNGAQKKGPLKKQRSRAKSKR